MSYQVLARKWRPRTFADLVGQTHVVRPLVNALDRDRLHHAFLFTGTRGVGKTTIARILAKSLNCETGVTSRPCGTCSACIEVDEGRYIDLLEVDAASRTKVDDTRELLDNVQYAPTRGRYKVYLIDEVHMLSGHSFNALLKTLEEPPPHVKFLLATTDPQKLPVTVLSRCLQFSLKRLSREEIANQLQKILDAEAIEYDAESIKLLARAADGSMRDGLSLMDQAISFGGGRVAEADVSTMLGTINKDTVSHVLQALVQNDPRAALAAVAEVVDRGGDPEVLLEELARALHRIAVVQTDATLASDDDEYLRTYAASMLPEDVQLYYQIGVIGRRDLPFAPDPRTGVEMTLVRMMAFRPVEAGSTSIAPSSAGSASTLKSETAKTIPSPAKAAIVTANTGQPQSWTDVVTRLNLSGILRELVNNTTQESDINGTITLVLNESCSKLLNKEREAGLKEALEQYYGRSLRLIVRIGRSLVETPAQTQLRTQDERQQAAIQAINDDPNIQALRERFGARVNPESIRPKS